MSTPTEIARVKIPFTTYDVFGYLIPGATFVLAIFLFEWWGRGALRHMPAVNLFLETRVLVKDSDILTVLYALAAIAFIYTTGHVVATVSSLCLDRVLVNKAYGYPYELLLNIHGDEIKPSKLSWRPFYRALFFWTNAYLIARYVNITFLDNDHSVSGVLNWAGAALVFLLLVKAIASGIRNAEKTRLHTYFYSGHGIRAREWVKRGFLMLSGPYDALTALIGSYLDSRKAFKAEFLEQYNANFYAVFGLKAQSAETNNYWLSYCYVADNSPACAAMVTNWLHLYSFARNLSCALYMAFLYCILSTRMQHAAQVGLVINFAPAVLFVAAAVMLVRYYYLYVCYYTKFIFRSFVYVSTQRLRGQRELSEEPATGP